MSFDRLPTDVLTRLFGFFNMASISNLGITSKNMYHISQQDEAWLPGPGFVNLGVSAKEICKQLLPLFNMAGNNYFDLLRSNVLTIDNMLSQALMSGSRRDTKIEDDTLKSLTQIVYLHTENVDLLSKSLEKVNYTKLKHSNRKDTFIAHYATCFVNYLKFENKKINDEKALNMLEQTINNSSFTIIQVDNLNKLNVLLAKLNELKLLNKLPPIIMLAEKECLHEIIKTKFHLPIVSILPLELDVKHLDIDSFCDAINPIWNKLTTIFENFYSINKIETMQENKDWLFCNI